MGRLGYYLWSVAKIFFKIILSLMVIALVVPAVLTFFPELPKFLIFRNRAISAKSFEPTAFNLTGHNFYLPLNTGLIPVWHLVPVADYVASDRKKSEQNMIHGNKTIIFLVHGAFHSRYYMEKKRSIYSKQLARGYHVITFDYKGFGENVGDTDGLVAVEETKVVYRWLRNKVGTQRIVVWGTSLGGGVAIEALRTLQLLERSMPRVVIEAAFASTEETVRSKTPKFFIVPMLMLTKQMREEYSLTFDNMKSLPLLKTDIFHLHSKSDSRIPYSHALMIQKSMQKAGRDEHNVVDGTYRLKLYDKDMNLPHVIMSSETYNCMDDVSDFLDMSHNITLKALQNNTGKH